MSTPTEIRRLEPTQKFCMFNAGKNPDERMVRIASELTRVLEPAGVKIEYFNICNIDPNSKDYNPDGLIGHFQATQFR